MRLILALFCAVFFWGSAFVGVSLALESYTPESAALLRIFVAFLASVVIYSRLRDKTHVHLSDKIKAAILGAIGMGVYSLSLNIGEQDLPASVSGFVVGQMPLLAAIGAAIFLKEIMTTRLKVGVLISLGGLFIIAFCGKRGFHFSPGMLWVSLTALCGALYSLLQKPMLKRIPTIQFICYSIWGAFLLLLIIFCVRPENIFSQIAFAKISSTLSLIYLGLFPSIISYIGWSYALGRIDVAKAGITLYCMPLIGAILAAIILKEIPTHLEIVGMALAFSGSLVGSLRFKRVRFSPYFSRSSTSSQEEEEKTK